MWQTAQNAITNIENNGQQKASDRSRKEENDMQFINRSYENNLNI